MVNRHPAIVQLWHPQALSWSPWLYVNASNTPWLRICSVDSLPAAGQNMSNNCAHWKCQNCWDYPNSGLLSLPHICPDISFFPCFAQFKFRVDIGCSSTICVIYFLTQTFYFHFVLSVFDICLFQEYFGNIFVCFLFWHLFVSGPHPGGAQQVAVDRWWNLGQNHRLGEK